jgi:hypothetical protein
MPGLMTQSTTAAEVYIDSRLRDEPPETATERARHAYQIHHPQRLSEELAGAEEAFEHELARRREEAAAPPPPEPEVPTLDTMEADAHRRIVVLTEQRKRLSFDALTDEDVRLELSNVEAEIEAAETELERIALARVEEKRREPLEAAERRKVEKARQLADKMDPRVAALETKADAELAVAAKTLSELRTARRQRHEHRVEAEEAKPITAGWGRDTSYESATFYAFGQHDVGDMIERAVGHPPARPLAEES